MKEKKENNKAEEPFQNYDKISDYKVVHSFSSIGEQEQDNYKFLANLSAEQHLQNATSLIKRIFAEDLKKNPKLGTILIID